MSLEMLKTDFFFSFKKIHIIFADDLVKNRFPGA